MDRILLTGAAGIVGSLIRPLFAERHNAVLLSDVVNLAERDGRPLLDANESFCLGDIRDAGFVNEVTSDVDGIVHLAGMVGPDYTFDEVIGPNVIGTNNLFAAAREHQISQVVYASSHHAVGYFRRGDQIDHRVPPRPDSQYGLSKAFGEAAGAYYADKFGINVLAIRIGYAAEQAIDERRMHTWISPRDLVQLIEIGLRTDQLGFEIVYGVSDNPDPFFDNSNAARLGYVPQDRSLDHLADPRLATQQPDPKTLDGSCVGGPFTSLGFVGDPKRILRRCPPSK